MAAKTRKHRTRGKTGKDLYQSVTDTVIAQLERGCVPWVQPRGNVDISTPLGLPSNAHTGRNYSGINILLLWGAAIETARRAQIWLTFKQALALGGNVRMCAEEILLAREAHFPATIAELYDPEKMPADLRAAHDHNDEVLERIYLYRSPLS